MTTHPRSDDDDFKEEDSTEPGRQSWCECEHNLADLRIMLQLLHRTDLKPEVMMLLGELAGHFINEPGMREELADIALKHRHSAAREGALLALARDPTAQSRGTIEHIARHDQDRFVAPTAQRLLRMLNQRGYVTQTDRVRMTKYKPEGGRAITLREDGPKQVVIERRGRKQHVDYAPTPKVPAAPDFVDEEITDTVHLIQQQLERRR